MKRPFWLAIWILIFEVVFIAVLIPVDWTGAVLQRESQLLENRLGKAEYAWVHGKARRWFSETVIENGLYSAVQNHLIPTPEQAARSRGIENIGVDWFSWIDGRLRAIANVYYHMLTRFALLETWAPYFLVLLIPAVYDGFATWQIKRTNFAYSSPLLHQYSTVGIAYVCIGLLTVFITPIVVDPTLIPASIMVICVMSGLMIGNLQKRV